MSGIRKAWWTKKLYCVPVFSDALANPIGLLDVA